MRRDKALEARWGYAEASSAGGALKICGCIERRRYVCGIEPWMHGGMRRHRALGALKVCGGIKRWGRAGGIRRYRAPEICVRRRALDARWGYTEASSAEGALKICGGIERRRYV